MHAAKARAMKAGAGAFDIDDFVSKLITFMGGRRGGGAGPKDRSSGGEDEYDGEDDDDDDGDDEPLDWEKIGRKALAKSRRVPLMDFMCVLWQCYPPPPTPLLPRTCAGKSAI
jgi:non-structural maintenance of chromosomes element 4